MHDRLEDRLAAARALAKLPRTRGDYSPNWWEQLIPEMELVVSILYDLDVNDWESFLEEIKPKFADVNPVIIYRSIRKSMLNQEGGNSDVEERLKEVAKAWIKKLGCRHGTIKQTIHLSKPQLCVEIYDSQGKAHCFVRNHNMRGYRPTMGEEVLFFPKIHQITFTDNYRRRVVAVVFYPAT